MRSTASRAAGAGENQNPSSARSRRVTGYRAPPIRRAGPRARRTATARRSHTGRRRRRPNRFPAPFASCPATLLHPARRPWLRRVTRRYRPPARSGRGCIRRAETAGTPARDRPQDGAALPSRALQFALERGKRTSIEDVSGLEPRAPRQVHGIAHEREIAGLVAVGREHEPDTVLLRRGGEGVRKVHPLGVAVELEQASGGGARAAERLEVR